MRLQSSLVKKPANQLLKAHPAQASRQVTVNMLHEPAVRRVEGIGETLIACLFLAFIGLILTVMLLEPHVSFSDLSLLEVYFVWFLISLLSHGIVALAAKVAFTDATPTQMRVLTLATAILLALLLPESWLSTLDSRVIDEYPLNTKLTLSPPANWVLERRYPSGQHSVQSFVPPPQCSSKVSQIMLSVQYLCGGRKTIHGLWYSPQAPCIDCPLPPSSSSLRSQMNDELLQFEFSQPHLNASGLLPYLERLWPNCVPNSSNENFWRHEWEKHGSCTGLPISVYFSLAMDIFKAHGHKCQDHLQPHRECRLCFRPSLALQSPHLLSPVQCNK